MGPWIGPAYKSASGVSDSGSSAVIGGLQNPVSLPPLPSQLCLLHISTILASCGCLLINGLCLMPYGFPSSIEQKF